jgi:hypothetical protein
LTCTRAIQGEEDGPAGEVQQVRAARVLERRLELIQEPTGLHLPFLAPAQEAGDEVETTVPGFPSPICR